MKALMKAKITIATSSYAFKAILIAELFRKSANCPYMSS